MIKEEKKKKKKSANKNKKIEAGKITRKKVEISAIPEASEYDEEPKGRASTAKRIVHSRGRSYGEFS